MRTLRLTASPGVHSRTSLFAGSSSPRYANRVVTLTRSGVTGSASQIDLLGSQPSKRMSRGDGLTGRQRLRLGHGLTSNIEGMRPSNSLHRRASKQGPSS